MDAIVASDNSGFRVRDGDRSWNAYSIAASENFFDGIGTGFAAGRGFSPAAGDPLHPAPEIVLHYDTWRNRFGGAPETIGQWLEVNGQSLQIVGVAAPGFSGPSGTAPQLWIPASWRDKLNPGMDAYSSVGSCCAQLFGHLRPDVSRAQAQAELHTLSTQFRNSEQRTPGRVQLSDPSLLANPGMDPRVSQVFLLLSLASGLILLLACANVANLQLARAQTRRREIAVRLSLGAARGRILRQLLAESVLLASLAGLVTLAMTNTVPNAIILWIAPSEERLSLQFVADWRVVAFLAGASFATGLLFGLAPALSVVRDAVSSGLREGGRTATGGRRLRALFLVAQVAVCATVLGCSALLLRAMQQARRIDPGFRWESVIVVAPNLLSSGTTDVQSAAITAALSERLLQLPGVDAVAGSTLIPLGNSFSSTSTTRPNTKESIVTFLSKVSYNYLRTLHIPMIAGRDFDPADEARNDVVILNEALANQLLPGQDPIGKTVAAMGTRQVIGVARNSSVRELSTSPELHFYVPSRGERSTRLLLRHTGPAAPLLSEIPKLARSFDSRILATAAPFEQNLTRARRAAQIAATIAAALSLLALVLACVGIYGVAAYHVAQRTREIGVRMALGARPEQIVGMVLSQNLKAVAIGGVVGLAGALGFGQLLRTLLYGLSPADPFAVATTIAILALMALLAAWPNARRAASIEPATALRHD
jgi:predicted permease